MTAPTSEPNQQQPALSRHAILDLYNCSRRDLLDDLEGMQKLFHDTAKALSCTIVNEVFHRFSPQGVSGVIVIAESHLSVHTWPEIGYAAIDLYTCGDPRPLENMPNMLSEALGSDRHEFQLLERGFVDRAPDYREQPHVLLANKGLSRDNKWLTEKWAEQVLWTVAVKDVIRDRQSKFQNIQILDTERLGRVLVLDGQIQCAAADEASYHEMIVHPALCREGASSPQGDRRVLVIGGGDGGASREALRHDDVSRVDLVELDEEVVFASRQLLPNIWRHPDPTKRLDDDARFHVHIADGLQWLADAAARDESEKYDLIVVDSPDPVGPGTTLYTEKFFGLVHAALKEGGAASVQGGSFWYSPTVFQTVHWGLKSAFQTVQPLECFTAVYPGGVWNLQIGIKGSGDPSVVDKARANALGDLDWYNAKTHAAAFALPPNALRILEKKPPPLAQVSAQIAPA